MNERDAIVKWLREMEVFGSNDKTCWTKIDTANGDPRKSWRMDLKGAGDE